MDQDTHERDAINQILVCPSHHMITPWSFRRCKRPFRSFQTPMVQRFITFAGGHAYQLQMYKITLQFITINVRGPIHSNTLRIGGALEHVPRYVTALGLQMTGTLNERNLSQRPKSELCKLTQFHHHMLIRMLTLQNI